MPSRVAPTPEIAVRSHWSQSARTEPTRDPTLPAPCATLQNREKALCSIAQLPCCTRKPFRSRSPLGETQSFRVALTPRSPATPFLDNFRVADLTGILSGWLTTWATCGAVWCCRNESTPVKTRQFSALGFFRNRRKVSAVKNLAGALHADRVRCTLQVVREVKMEIPV